MSDESPRMLGRYQVLEEIGRGAFSVVYRAENVALKKPIALKLLLPALFSDPQAIQRFIREARTAAALNHPKIVRVLDLDQVDERLFMALEYLPGGDLAAWIKAHTPVNFRQAAQMVGDIAEALDHAHAQGVVHGDVKPGNVLLAESEPGAPPVAKLADFGLLRAVEQSGVTSADMTMGTPYYISPEQAEGKPAAPASDQYALGVLAYELLTGSLPFAGDGALAIYLKHIREQPPAPSARNPLITQELEQVLLKALSKDPAGRYASCGEFARALRQAVAATEAQTFQNLIGQAQAALAAHQPEKATPLLHDALQIMPGESQAKTLVAQLERQEQAQSGYQAANRHMSAARQAAQTLRAAAPDAADPQGVLERLAPRPQPAWRTFWQRWKWLLLSLLGVLALGLTAALGWKTYAGSPAGAAHRGTLVAAVRSSTPTPTFTPTFTPSPTLTPTITPSLTPTITPSSTLTPTPTLTPSSTSTITPSPTPTPLPTRIVDAQGIEMVLIPAGTFQMGSSAVDALAECQKFRSDCQANWFNNQSPVHRVILSNAFYMDIYEVTNAAYAECVAAGACSAPSQFNSYSRDSYYGNPTYDNYPVIYASWNQANTYCAWRGARLPKEAEWEYAARGGLEEMNYPWGDTFSLGWANFCDKNCESSFRVSTYNDGYADTSPVGRYAANNFGLYDMAGNVLEWVKDWYGAYPTGTVANPMGPASGEQRVLRGGSWVNLPYLLTVTYRSFNAPTYSNSISGFRCAANAPLSSTVPLPTSTPSP